MRGFFTKKRYDIDYAKYMKETKGTTPTEPCEICGLYKTCKSPKMPFTGKGRKGILVIAEAPGEEEDLRNTQLVGNAGQKLRAKLQAHGIDLDRDCFKTNALICRPPSNKAPTARQLKCCQPNWKQVIEKTKPRFIWLLGGKALETFYMGRLKKDDKPAISSWVRHCIPDKETGAWIFPMFHPSYLLQNPDENLNAYFELNLKWAVSCLDRPAPSFKDPGQYVTQITTFDELKGLLRSVNEKSNLIVHDYETTGIKPYREGHKILSIGFALNDEQAYAFPYAYPDHWSPSQLMELKFLWGGILRNENIKKVAHNIKFEHKWGKKIFGAETKGWLWCTLLNEHILDSRPKIKSLKTIALIRWGVEGYERSISNHIEAKAGTEFNTMHKVPLSDLLKYNGTDCILEKWLYNEQVEEFKRKRLDQPRQLLHEGILSLADAEDVGIPIDEAYYKTERKRLDDEEQEITRQLLTGKESELFKAQTGMDLKLRSPKHLTTLFFDILKETPLSFTEKGNNPSTDVEALKKLNSPFAGQLLRTRRLKKIKDYIDQYAREAVDGRIHPFFDLSTVSTYRSSSSRPNFQNIPKRDKEARLSVRKGIVPSKGRKISSADYKGIEVRVMAMYSYDPVLIKYIHDPTTDMHRDQAEAIFALPEEEITSDIRHIGKNCFVFPQFYGDYYIACAKSCWEESKKLKTKSGVNVHDHLSKLGIKGPQTFELHMKEVEDRFWDTLRVTKEWRDSVVDFYQRKGYVETFFGFRRSGYLRRNQIVNMPVQATAFHLLLYSYIHLHNISKEKKWETYLLGQIHDELLYDLIPEEEEEVYNCTNDVMCKWPMEDFPWINVPLEIEFESTEIDGYWAEKKEVTFYEPEEVIDDEE